MSDMLDRLKTAIADRFRIERELGVTAAGGERLTETGVSVGTPHYMTPAFPAALLLLWR